MKCATCEGAASPERTSEFVIAQHYESNRYRQSNMDVREYSYRNIQEITLGLCEDCFWPAFTRVMKKEAKTITIFVSVFLLISALLMIPASIGMKNKWWMGGLILACIWGFFVFLLIKTRGGFRSAAANKDVKQAKRFLDSALWPQAQAKMKAQGCNELFTPMMWQAKLKEIKRNKFLKLG